MFTKLLNSFNKYKTYRIFLHYFENNFHIFFNILSHKLLQKKGTEISALKIYKKEKKLFNFLH